MQRLRSVGIGLGVVLATLLIAGSAGGSTIRTTDERAKSPCDTIRLGGQVRIFYKLHMSCSRARGYARRLTHGRDEPNHFDCTSGSGFRDGGFCEHESKNERFGWHPADKARLAKNRVFGVEDCGDPEVKPDRIVFACADFGLFANHFDWKNWGHRKAKTSGVLHAKVCEPDCASGYFKDYPVEITVHKIKTWSCNGFRARFYRKIKLSFPGERPPRIDPYVHSEFICF